MRSENVQALLRKAGGLQASRHRPGGLGGVPHRVGRVDLDELFENLPGQKLVPGEFLHGSGRFAAGQEIVGK
jgi:hypothetical protein